MKIKSFMTETNNTKIDIKAQFQSVGSLNFSGIFSKFLGKKNHFHIELGYSQALAKQPWRITDYKNTNPVKARREVRKVQPGGIIFGIGYNFGKGLINPGSRL